MPRIVIPEADEMLDSKVPVLDHGWVVPIDYMGGDQRIVDAARISVAGDKVVATSSDRQLVRYLLRHKHTTPFEKVRFEFALKAPIFVMRQWIRHRMSSTNEMSARYGELPNEFYVPAKSRMQMQSTNNKQGSGDLLSDQDARVVAEMLKLCHKNCYDVYGTLLEDYNLARELARGVLPVNIYTQWYWTVDLWNLMHFLRLRLDSHAQYEIRVYAEELYKFAKTVAPLALEAFDDYILNSTTLSKQEIAVLEEILSVSHASLDKPTLEKKLGSKREVEEFLSKLKTLKEIVQ